MIYMYIYVYVCLRVPTHFVVSKAKEIRLKAKAPIGIAEIIAEIVRLMLSNLST